MKKTLISILVVLLFLSFSAIGALAAETEENIGSSISISGSSTEEIFIVNAKHELLVYTSPSNTYGLSLWNGETVWRNELRKLMDDVSQIHCNQDKCFILVLKTDGSLWKLANTKSTTEDDLAQWAPVQIATDVKSVSQWNYNTLVLKNDKTLWQFEYDQFGTLTITKVAEDVIFATPTFSGGMYIKSDNSLWGWMVFFKLPGAEYEYLRTPHKLMDNVKYAASNNNSDCYFVIKTDGSLWGWGDNSSGEMGNGGKYDFKKGEVLTGGGPIDHWFIELTCYEPSRIMGSVKYVYPTYNGVYAVKENGDVWVWGDSCEMIIDNDWGVLRDFEYEKMSPHRTEGDFENIVGISAVYCNVDADVDYNYVTVKDDGSVWAKGVLFYGAVGNDKDNIGFVKLTEGGVAGQTGFEYASSGKSGTGSAPIKAALTSSTVTTELK